MGYQGEANGMWDIWGELMTCLIEDEITTCYLPAGRSV